MKTQNTLSFKIALAVSYLFLAGILATIIVFVFSIDLPSITI